MPTPQNSALTIVTAADTQYANGLLNLLRSIESSVPGTPTVVYDLGLSPDDRDALPAWAELRPFDFAAYPPHVGVRLYYAWKPIIIAEAASRGGQILWMDAGDLVYGNLTLIRFILRRAGLYSPHSADDIRKWTHPGTLQCFNAAPDLLDKRNRNGALIGFDTEQPEVRELIERWRDCALDMDCIVPTGSSLDNHRYDQAVLSVLMYQHQAKHGTWLAGHTFEVMLQRARVTPSEAAAIMQQLRKRRLRQIVRLAQCYVTRS